VTGVIAKVAALARRPRAPLAPDAATILSALPLPLWCSMRRTASATPIRRPELFFDHSSATLASLSLEELLPPDSRVFSLLQQVRLLDSPVADHEPHPRKPTGSSHRRLGARCPPRGVPGHVVLSLQDGSDRGDAGPAAALPGRGAGRHRHGGDAGARDQEPALGHPRGGRSCWSRMPARATASCAS
jgi:hypothetical protein